MASPQPVSRYNVKDRAQWFIFLIIKIFVATVVLYVAAHLLWKPCACAPAVETMVKVLPTGRVIVLDAEAIDWYIGNKSKIILQEISQRGAQIGALQEEIETARVEIQARARNGGFGGLDEWEPLTRDGSYGDLLKKIDYVRNNWPPDYADALGRKLLNGLYDKVARAAAHQKDQQELLQSLRPPVATSCFWTSPCAAMFEVLFWAFFGVITNLLVTSVEFLRKGVYRPIERWVAYTKLIYGPVLSLILVMAILNGWFDLGQYETRAWSLPLISFLFGYATRKVAILIDKLFEKVLGTAGDSIEKGPAEAIARRKERLQSIMDSAQPRSVSELGEKAKAIAQEIVKVKVAEKEAHL